MYNPTHITETIYYVGVNDRHKALFENQMPLPCGVSYNSYLIKDEKIALIDTVDAAFFETFIKKIEAIVNNQTIDYLVINHMEPDHSGSIELIRKYYPDIQIVGNKKTLEMLQGYYEITDKVMEVGDGAALELGKHKLNFTLTPMVHWPETMMSYDATERVLFSGDAFGCFGTLDGGVIDEAINTEKYWDEMRRYYAGIVGKFGAPVQSALSKLKGFPVDYICSTHGPVWHVEIEKVMSLYNCWSLYKSEKQGVVIAYGTMYGHTEQMAEAIAEGLVAGGIKEVILHDVSKTDSYTILAEIFKYSGLVIGSPTQMNELFPAIEALLHKLEVRGVKNKVFASFGSFTWAGVALKRIAPVAESLKWEIVGSVEEKQALKEDKYKECLALGRQMADKLKSFSV